MKYESFTLINIINRLQRHTLISLINVIDALNLFTYTNSLFCSKLTNCQCSLLAPVLCSSPC